MTNEEKLKQVRSPELRAKFERLIAAAHNDTAIHNFDQLQYAEPVKGEPFRFYLFDKHGWHRGGQWATSATIRYPNEEITAHVARMIVETHIKRGFEVRICNGGDMLIFHAVKSNVIYPTDADKVATFWERV